MIQVGKNVTQQNDSLQAVSIEQIYKGLTNPNSELAKQLVLLRQLQTIDITQYRKQKTNLPYLVCGHFHPNFRKKENFAFTEYFILDLDHLHQFDINVEELKIKLKQEEQIVLLFISPSNDGLKAVFKLANKITDSAYYSMFYKLFAAHFANKYQLQGVVDLKTSDVSRCCFMSHDSQAYYNTEARVVDDTLFMQNEDINAIDFFKSEVKKSEKESKAAFDAAEIFSFPAAKTVLTDTILQDIKMRMNPNRTLKLAKNYYQPEELEGVLDGLKQFLEEHLIQIVAINPISYGKQIQMRATSKKAEVNLFYGKKGFTVVKTTKTGSCPELATLAHTIITDYFFKLRWQNQKKMSLHLKNNFLEWRTVGY